MQAGALFDFCHREAGLSWSPGGRATEADISVSAGESLSALPYSPWRSAVVAMLGEPELAQLQHAQHRLGLFHSDARVLIVTDGIAPPQWLRQAAAQAGVALWQTCHSLAHIQLCLTPRLYRAFAPRCQVHAVLLRVAGVGVLVLGEPGVGKGNLALAMLARGHGLVADDAVNLIRNGDGELLGSDTGRLPGYLFVRGLGALDVVAEFGAMALAFETRVDLLILLAAPDDAVAGNAKGNDNGVAAHAELSGECFQRSWLGVSLNGLVVRADAGAPERVEAYTRRYLLARSGRSVADEFRVGVSESINKRNVRE